jgi:predicted negative regulator of RcsB-dependent stress response
MEYMSESEQVEQLKKWWHEYGVAAIIGILIAVIGGFGWHGWQQHREKVLNHASMRYEQLLSSIVNGETYAVEVRANRLITRYPHTPYAQLAALQLARQAVYQGKFLEAEEKLRWLSQHGDSDALRAVANIRLARVLLTDKKPQEALNVLAENNNPAYFAAVEVVRGDILVSQHKTVEAKQAYESALKAFPAIEVMQPLLRMKLDDLATTTNTNHV